MREAGLPTTFDRRHELFMLDYWQDRCAVCGATADFWHWIAWDHWIAVKDPDCPGTIPGNILPLCHGRKGAATLGGTPACNNSKFNQKPEVWLTAKLGPRKAKAKLREIERYFAAVTALGEKVA